MNLQRLRQLRNFIANNADHFNYNWLLRWNGAENRDSTSRASDRLTNEEFKNLVHNCGSIGCIAGWTAVLFATSEEYYEDNTYILAKRHLGLTRQELPDPDWLFEPWQEASELDIELDVGFAFEQVSFDNRWQLEEAIARLDWLIEGNHPDDYESKVVKRFWEEHGEDISQC